MLKFIEMPSKDLQGRRNHPAYTDGFIARMFETALVECPHDKDTCDWHIWGRGWRAADRIGERKDADPEYRQGLEDGTSGAECKSVSFSYTTGWADGEYTRRLWRNIGGSDI